MARYGRHRALLGDHDFHTGPLEIHFQDLFDSKNTSETGFILRAVQNELKQPSTVSLLNSHKLTESKISQDPRGISSNRPENIKEFAKASNSHGGAVESFLNPKLTNLLKSENTSRLWFSAFPDALSPALDPVGGPLCPGPVILAKMPSPPRGNDTRLAPGLTRLPPACPVADGSMSSEERNEVLSRSVLVLVMVRNELRRLSCTDFGVPLRSKI